METNVTVIDKSGVLIHAQIVAFFSKRNDTKHTRVLKKTKPLTLHTVTALSIKGIKFSFSNKTVSFDKSSKIEVLGPEFDRTKLPNMADHTSEASTNISTLGSKFHEDKILVVTSLEQIKNKPLRLKINIYDDSQKLVTVNVFQDTFVSIKKLETDDVLLVIGQV